jgi:PTH1 family peptidyl-tRNA hydrolase
LWLLVGLGNPGSRYARTRHNIGYRVLEVFSENHNLSFKVRKEYKICKGSIEGTEIALLEPLTFMNRSGVAVRKVKDRLNIPPSKIIVIHDDLDMEAGRLKIKKNGSSGGHRGVESIIENIGSKDFIRVKIGIGKENFIPAEKYVLSKFKRNELPSIRLTVDMAVESLHSIIKEGPDKAMNRFN